MTILIYAGNLESDDQESQTSLQESMSKETDGPDLQMEESRNGKSDESPKSIDIEKLKQLQNLYRLNLIQQQMEQDNESKIMEPMNASGDSTSLFSSLENSFQKLSAESATKVTPTVPATSSVCIFLYSCVAFGANCFVAE